MILGTMLALVLQLQGLAPGARYEANIPPLKQVTGYDFGERVTPPEEIIRYLKTLHEAAPDRTRLVKYAETWEGRPLYALVIAGAERIRRLEAIGEGMRRLADPRALGAGEAEQLIKDLPVVVALLHGVHGNEISSGEAALAEAYHLLAAQGDAAVDLIRREALVIIDPMQNPDGRARFVAQNLLGQAASPDPEPAAAEHDEPWPGGRSNHYLFDLNRDWFAQTQPESRGRARLLLDWAPQVVVDLHEMGGDSTYYFPPGADPPNPYMTSAQRGWLESFGRETAARFDERGFAYFNREVFDAFYPGYGVSWPMAQGAIGMTFEMASARGLAYRRQDETTLSYADGMTRHFTAALSTAATAARHRERLLRDYLAFRRGAGRGDEAGGPRAFLLPPGTDPGQALRLARALLQNGILVERAAEPVKIEGPGGRTLPAGTFVVPLPQPAGWLARNLLDAQVTMDAGFLKRQEERRRRRLPDQIYDITAWSLPLLYDVECVAVASPPTVKTARVELGGAAGPAGLPDAVVGYAVAWNATGAAATIEALRGSLRVRFLESDFTLAGRGFARGTVVFRVAENGPDLKARLGAIAARHGAEVVKLDSAFVSAGVSLGSNQAVALKAPRVLLAWDAPAGSLSAGWARFVLERRYGQAATAARVGSLGRVDLRRYDVLVLPAGNYTSALGAEAVRRIRDWVGAGGTLVTLGEASRWAAGEGVALLGTTPELRQAGTAGKPDEKFDYERAIQPAREQPETTPGALLRVRLDEDHWLAAGTDGEVQAMVEGDRVFAPIKLDRGRNVGVYAARERLLASGLIWEPALNQLPQKAFLIHQPLGQGHVIAFAEDPNFRAYAEATQLLFINAVVLGAAY